MTDGLEESEVPLPPSPEGDDKKSGDIDSTSAVADVEHATRDSGLESPLSGLVTNNYRDVRPSLNLVTSSLEVGSGEMEGPSADGKPEAVRQDSSTSTALVRRQTSPHGTLSPNKFYNSSVHLSPSDGPRRSSQLELNEEPAGHRHDGLYYSRTSAFAQSVHSFQSGRLSDGEHVTLPRQPSMRSIPIRSQISLGQAAEQANSRRSTPPPDTSHILRSFQQTRGRHETSNTRAAGSTPMTSTKYHENRAHDEGTRAMSSVETYNRVFERLGTVAFFGASIAWSSVFGAQRGDLVSLTWSASLFMNGAVIAGAASLITYSDQINIDRDMLPRRILRILAIMTALMALAGVCMICVASFDLRGIPDDYQASARTRAPAALTLGISVISIGVALALRIAYSNNLYRYRF